MKVKDLKTIVEKYDEEDEIFISLDGAPVRKMIGFREGQRVDVTPIEFDSKKGVIYPGGRVETVVLILA